jgi:hypothetical protein
MLFVLFAWQFGRSFGKRIQGSWLVVGVTAVLIIAADIWHLVWG